MPAPVTHRCIGTYEYGTIACKAKRHADGTISGQSCGEPCSWIMGKAGHGQPEYQTNPDGTRFDPSTPDKGYE